MDFSRGGSEEVNQEFITVSREGDDGALHWGGSQRESAGQCDM